MYDRRINHQATCDSVEQDEKSAEITECYSLLQQYLDCFFLPQPHWEPAAENACSDGEDPLKTSLLDLFVASLLQSIV